MAYQGRIKKIAQAERYAIIKLNDSFDFDYKFENVVAFSSNFLEDHWQTLIETRPVKLDGLLLEFDVVIREKKAPLAKNVIIVQDTTK